MFYSVALTIPANTPESNPGEERVQLTHGVITHIEVEFPAGCRGKVYAYVRDSLHQVWPTNPDGKFRTDGRVIAWDDYLEIFQSPYVLTVGGWNNSTKYPHTITFYFELTPRDIAERGVIDMEALMSMMQVAFLAGRRWRISG